MDSFQIFVDRFNKNDEIKLVNQLNIDRVERDFSIQLPNDLLKK